MSSPPWKITTKTEEKKEHEDYRNSMKSENQAKGELKPHPLSPRTMTLSKVLLGAAMMNKANLVGIQGRKEEKL